MLPTMTVAQGMLPAHVKWMKMKGIHNNENENDQRGIGVIEC